MLISAETPPFCIPISNTQRSQLLHMLTNTYFLFVCFFLMSHPSGCEVVSHRCGFNLILICVVGRLE